MAATLNTGKRTTAATSPVFITADSLHSIVSHDSLIRHFNTHLPTASQTLNSPIRQRPIWQETSLRRVIIWNRTMEKAKDLAGKLQEEFAGGALVKGEKLKMGAHLDLVGSFKETMWECDDEAIRRGKVFVDNEAALVETGELMERGVIKKSDNGGDLLEFINGQKVGRRKSGEIPVFKSEGSAVVDIVAQFVYQAYMEPEV
ncbi:Ornithine cyclodeaminase [Tripterygium wilfordii]|uniref:Ornithine cyclodeaminase n=1 Tax=Tripterygium wilfordii TaxID=458696 RepID=A0A7J7CE71_TRIWF|nr:Ornithine cyclodeaminase [Tripterygium wilfordii]